MCQVKTDLARTAAARTAKNQVWTRMFSHEGSRAEVACTPIRCRRAQAAGVLLRALQDDERYVAELAAFQKAALDG